MSDERYEPEARPNTEASPEAHAWQQAAPSPASAWPGRFRAVARVALVALAVAAMGPVIGWLWHLLSPRFTVIKVEGGFIYAEAEPEQVVAADGWFALLGAGAGLLVALVAWLALRRRRGVAVLVGLAIGSLAGAVLAGWIGTMIGMSDFLQARDAAALGERVQAPLSLRITDLETKDPWPGLPNGVVAVQALMAVFVYTCCAGLASEPNLAPSSDRESGPDQLGPGLTGNSDSDTGTART